MKNRFFKTNLFLLLGFIVSVQVSGQVDYDNLVNYIPTAVPFISITPDSRASAMGGTGVATSPDFYSQYWNPSKYAFIEKNYGIGLAFTPWLRHLISDINLYNLTGFYRIDNMQVLSASLRYFSIGEITYTQSAEDDGYQVQPNEFAIDVAYNRRLSERLSGGVAFRYIRSDLNVGAGGDESMQAGNSFAADLSFYYHTPIQISGQNSEISAGINVSNIGSKISYNGDDKEFIPTNLRLGVALQTEIDSYNSIGVSIDANKLLVPTLNAPDEDEDADDYRQFYNNMGTLKGMFSSFSDAPRGFEEELEEINFNIGAEYWYDKQFAIRAGYFYENKNKGGRTHFSAGIGLRFNILTLDASYLIAQPSNPLANTIRFSLGIDIK